MTLASMTLGMLVVYIFGFVWLAGLIGVEKAWTFGVQPFLVADVFKILLAALSFPQHGIWLKEAFNIKVNIGRLARTVRQLGPSR